MEAVAAVVGPLVTEACKLLCGCACSKISSAANLPSNLAVLEKEMDNLMDRRMEVKEEEEVAEKEGNKISAQVVNWLKDVENLQLRVNPIQKKMVDMKKPFACFLKCSMRCRAGEVEAIREEIERLLEAGNFPTGTRRPRAVQHIPVPSIRDQTTASKLLDETMKLLYNDNIRRIGIWGLGGIGKTTLVNNLNNELKTTSTQPFNIVIWAKVSKILDIKQVQSQIARRLLWEPQTGASEQEMAIRLHQRLKNEKFVLILDDLWEEIDLDILGVPRPEEHEGCKIILTSRSMEVCRNMQTDIDVRMSVLNDKETWQLFCQNAGDVVHLEEIKPFAKAIASECCGLPLAITIVGAAMRKKTKVELWDDTLKQLQSSLPTVHGIEAKVYMPLKLSYDSLGGNNIKSCFLYCSLFSEDFSIEISELVQCWLAEGLIDEQKNFVDSINRGVALLESLKDSCLLEDGVEEGTVKMHDLVRDVAIWIISKSPEDGCKSLVCSGMKLSEISDQDLSKLNSNSHQRVSFMDNKITRLPDSEIQCSEASSLLLQHNLALEMVPASFLQGFLALRLLNLGNTRIQSLPPSLPQLGDLRALLLRNCSSLGKLPPLERFSRLQMLNLGGTGIGELPRGLENLCNLKLLDLSDTKNLKTIQAGIISRLSCLEDLQLKNSAYHFHFNGEEKRGDATFEDLRSVDGLLILSITFKSIPRLRSEDVSWIKRLRAFQIFIGQPPQDFHPRIKTTNEKIVIIGCVDFPQESIEELWCIAKSLVLDNCRGMNEMVKDLAINIGGCFDGLSLLAITGVNMSLRPTGRWAASCDLLPNLKELIIKGLNELESISELTGYLGLRFLRLKIIEVRDCSDIKYLFSHGDFFRALPNGKVSGRLGEVQKFLLPKLEEIKVSGCQNLDKLFNYDSGQNMAPYPVVPKLRILELEKLCNLRTLCRQEETWPCLEKVEVIGCNRLERLPLTEQNAGAIREIKGESEWWNALEWNDDETKSSMQPYFRSI